MASRLTVFDSILNLWLKICLTLVFIYWHLKKQGWPNFMTKCWDPLRECRLLCLNASKMPARKTMCISVAGEAQHKEQTKVCGVDFQQSHDQNECVCVRVHVRARVCVRVCVCHKGLWCRLPAKSWSVWVCLISRLVSTIAQPQYFLIRGYDVDELCRMQFSVLFTSPNSNVLVFNTA